jgi:hypothetical protein
MAKYVKIKSSDFHKLLTELRGVETKKDQKSKTKPKSPDSIRKMLIKASDFMTAKSGLPYQVKMAILTTKGYSNPDPNKLDVETVMSDFKFADMQYIRLTTRFNKIAKSHTSAAKEIGEVAVKTCKKVKDCIDLVTKAST